MKKTLILLTIAIIFAGCANVNPNDRDVPVSKKMQIAENYFAKKKYRKAAEFYETIVFEKSAGFTAKAQMRLADCFFEQDDWLEARIEYDEMIRLFPDYPEIDKAYYNIGLCFFKESLKPQYTQEETIQSAEAFEQFIDKFPGNEKQDKAIEYIRKCHKKLIHKNYYNGYIYFKLQDYSSAEMYFKEVIESKLHDEYENKAYFYLAKIYKFWEEEYKLNLIMKDLQKYFPESKELKKLQKK